MKKLQSGRSMIEMLGVLAIIGVLSIGGLAAYNTAMERNRANELLNYASLCAVIFETDGTADCTAIAGIDEPTGVTAAVAATVAAADGEPEHTSITITGADIDAEIDIAAQKSAGNRDVRVLNGN